MISPDSLLQCLPHRLQVFSVLVGGMLIHMTIGGIDGSYGNIIPYVASYLRYEHGKEHNVKYNVMIWIAAIFDVGIGISSVFGGLLEKKIGQRFTILIAAAMIACGSACSYFAIRRSFWLWLLTYGLLNGIGMGIAWNIVLVCAMRWMPKHHGFASGVIQFGYAIGSSVFVAIQTASVNPANVEANSHGFFTQRTLERRVPVMFLVLAGIFSGMNIIGCFLLMNPRKERNITVTTPLLSDDKSNNRTVDYATENHPIDNQSEEILPRDVIRSTTFWSLWFTWICIVQPANFILSYYKVFGATFISDDFLLTALASAGAVTSGTSRIVWGYLGDRFSYQGAMACVSSLLTVTVGTMCVTRYAGVTLYFIWVLIAFFALGGPFALCPMAVTDAFGERNAVINNGLFLSSMAVSTVLSACLTTFLLESLSYCGMFALVAVFGFLALCITLTIHRTKYGRRIGKQKKPIILYRVSDK